MTHSLHRHGNSADLQDDFVMLIMAGPDRMKHNIIKERMAEILDILTGYEASLANCGTLSGGSGRTIAELRERHPWIIHAVFSSQEKLLSCLQELQTRDLGISVAISGCNDDVARICDELHLTPHTVHYSLGVHGKHEKLPGEGVLAISTMCGHAMVSSNLIADVVGKIAKGRMTHAEGAEKLSRMCDCGIFNKHKAERLLRQIS